MTEQELESSGIVVGKTETYDSNGHHEVKYFKRRVKSPLQEQMIGWYDPPAQQHASLFDMIGALFQGISQGLDHAVEEQNKRLALRQPTANDEEVVETDDETSDEAEEIEEQLAKARKQMEEMEADMQRRTKNMLAAGLLLGRYVH